MGQSLVAAFWCGPDSGEEQRRSDLEISVQPTPEDLSGLELFADLPPDRLAELASRFQIEEHPVGTMLTREGDAGYAFFVLVQGTARVAQGYNEIRVLGPGDFFGELSIVGDGRRTASVQASERVTLWSMFGPDFRTFEHDFPELAERIRSKYA
jgi:CRP-like cAMP-binding protein